MLQDKRGAMGAFVSISENLGTMLVFGLGIHLNYRYLALISSMAAASMTLLMVFMPESPRWALAKGTYLFVSNVKPDPRLHWDIQIAISSLLCGQTFVYFEIPVHV